MLDQVRVRIHIRHGVRQDQGVFPLAVDGFAEFIGDQLTFDGHGGSAVVGFRGCDSGLLGDFDQSEAGHLRLVILQIRGGIGVQVAADVDVGAVCEDAAPQLCHRGGDIQVSQRGAVGKSAVTDGGEGLRQRHGFQLGTAGEHVVADGRDAVGNHDHGQVVPVLEQTVTQLPDGSAANLCRNNNILPGRLEGNDGDRAVSLYLVGPDTILVGIGLWCGHCLQGEHGDDHADRQQGEQPSDSFFHR